MRNLDFSHLYSNAVGFELMARELEGLFEQLTPRTTLKSASRMAIASRSPWLASSAKSWSWRPKTAPSR